MDKNKSNIVGGVLLILGGLLVLAINFNLISWDIWRYIWKLWPLLLVGIGVKTLIGR